MINTAMWTKRNMWTNSYGDAVVRDGLQRQAHVSLLADGNFAGGFSTENPRTGDQLHYVLITGNESCVCMLDEEFQVLYKYPLGKGFNPTGPFQGAPLANGQIMMGAPGMPMLWGYTGSGFKVAEKTESSQSIDFSTISVPDGLCVSWQGRVVIAARDALFFSDVLSPRSFLGANSHNAPGLVYFLKVSDFGMLFVGTSEGMYTVAADSVYAGEILQPVFQKISEIPTKTFWQSALTSKGPVTLSSKGLVSTANLNGEELMLGDPTMPRSIGEPNHYVDFRGGRIFSTQEGPLVTLTPQSKSFLDNATGGRTILSVRINERQGFFSWWEPSSTRPTASTYTFSRFTNGFDFRGILEDGDGREFLMTHNMIYAVYGNVDHYISSAIEGTGESRAPKNGSHILGSIYGGVVTPPPSNPVIRYVITASDNVGSYQYISVRGTVKRSAPLSKGIPTMDDGISWYDIAPSAETSKYYEKTMQSIKHNFSERTQNPTIEIAVEGSGFRIGLTDVVAKGPGRERKVDGKTYNYTAVS